jgi:hypothetical protein
MNGGDRCPMSSSTSLDAQAAILVNGGGRGDGSLDLDSFFAVQMVLVIGFFIILHLLDNGINGCFLESLVRLVTKSHKSVEGMIRIDYVWPALPEKS